MSNFSGNGRVGTALKKSRTGIKGLDEVLEGGLPQGRPTLICGGAGSGKTLMASEFLAHGAMDFGEPGVFMAFEETEEELNANLASLGIDLDELVQQKKIFIDYVYVDRSEIEETGVYDLDGLFIRLADAIATVGAKRVVLDTLEAIFTGFSNEGILRSELRRLFRFLKDKGVTAVITGERGSGALSRYGLEEYVSDCVILLDHRVREGIATRLLRVVKYRGSRHGNDEYPFLIDEQGIWVLPITSIGMNYPVSREFISTGVPRLDTMLNGKGLYRGSSTLISGTSGVGKTSLAAQIAEAGCRRDERCLYLAYEESADQIVRNMDSIGIHLEQWIQQGLLLIHAIRPSLYGAEMHLLSAQKLVEEFRPDLVVIDPISNLNEVATTPEVKSLLVRMIDFFKMNQITAVFTNLTQGGANLESTEVGISSLMDTWILLRDIESNGERNRGMYILKARGLAHSNQIREFRLSSQGIELVDVYVGKQGALIGTARLSQEAAEKARKEELQQESEQRKRALELKRKLLQAQIEALQAEFKSKEEELLSQIEQEEERDQSLKKEENDIAAARWADILGDDKPES